MAKGKCDPNGNSSNFLQSRYFLLFPAKKWYETVLLIYFRLACEQAHLWVTRASDLQAKRSGGEESGAEAPRM